MSIVDKLKNNEFTKDELLKYLDSQNPIVLYEAMKCIIKNHITDKMIVEKLIQLSELLSEEHKMIGYYKVGHVAMGTLLKIGIDDRKVFRSDLDSFEKDMAIKFFQNA